MSANVASADAEAKPKRPASKGRRKYPPKSAKAKEASRAKYLAKKLASGDELTVAYLDTGLAHERRTLDALRFTSTLGVGFVLLMVAPSEVPKPAAPCVIISSTSKSAKKTRKVPTTPFNPPRL